MQLKLDMSCHLLNVYTKFQIDISKQVEEKSGKRGPTDGQTDGHCHGILHPFFKWAYDKNDSILMEILYHTADKFHWSTTQLRPGWPGISHKSQIILRELDGNTLIICLHISKDYCTTVLSPVYWGTPFGFHNMIHNKSSVSHRIHRFTEHTSIHKEYINGTQWRQ